MTTERGEFTPEDVSAEVRDMADSVSGSEHLTEYGRDLLYRAATRIESLQEENERLREALYYVTGEYHVARNHPDTVETCVDRRCERTFRALNPLTPVNVGQLLQQPPEQP